MSRSYCHSALLSVFVVFVAVLSTCLPSLSRAEGTAHGGKLRIGVYDSRAIAVAAVRSTKAAIQDDIRDLQRQLHEAEAAGDQKRAGQIKARGKNLQTVKHLQAFSNAPVDEYIARLSDQLPQIARENGVAAIVAKLDFQSDEVEVVDVTDALVQAFSPDEKTMKMIEDLRQHKPVEMVDVLGGAD